MNDRIRYQIEVAKSGISLFSVIPGDAFAEDERAVEAILNDLRARFPAKQGWEVRQIAFEVPPREPEKPSLDSLVEAATRQQVSEASDPLNKLIAKQAKRPDAMQPPVPVVDIPPPTGKPPKHRAIIASPVPDSALGLETANENRPSDMVRHAPSPSSRL
jgi:hypothetical protein